MIGLAPAQLATIVSGGLVGMTLGLFGGGGSVLAVPILVHAAGVEPHAAMATSAVAVAASAVGNLVPHARGGRLKWRCALVFSLFGVPGALIGAQVARAVDGERLLALFGVVMVAAGLAMLRGRRTDGDPNVMLTAGSASRLLPWLAGVGLGVGLLSGFFGVGGGFLIVPGLMLATGMPIAQAVGASLIGVAALGAATAASHAASGLVDWPLAGLFLAGALVGGALGARVGQSLAANKQLFDRLFAGLLITAGAAISAKGAWSLLGD
jgi:uncharacterized membrane protein YfcA